MDSRFLLSRRTLLGGLGALALSSVLPGTRPRARAKAPTRLLLVHVPEGMWSGAARPAAGSTQLGPILEALQPHQANLSVLNNLDMQSRDYGPGGDGHHRGVVHMFTGTEQVDENNAGGPSVDQKIAQSIGGGLPFASLQFAVRIVYGDTNSRPIWSGPGKVVPAMQSPWEAYKRIFGNFTPPGSSPAPTPKLDLRRSALDYALADSAALRNKLGARDRELLDSYQASLRDIEQRLMTTQAQMPASCALPQLGAAVDEKAEANYPAIGRLQMDLIVAAFQCGLTRVASLQWGNSNDQCTYSFLGVNTLGHDMAHNNNNCDPDHSKKLKVYRWYSEQAAYLLSKLKSIPEDGGTMLDNTLILWASEFSDSNGHSADKLMWLLMGNAGGFFKTGKVLDCGGRSVNDVHVSLCNALGLQTSSFGNPAYCKGALPGLT
ncbi:MAG: DUF1552 domain-containing protein [Myxococcales bacterium]